MSAPFAIPLSTMERHVYSGDERIAFCESPKHAKAIVRACNSHGALVAIVEVLARLDAHSIPGCPDDKNYLWKPGSSHGETNGLSVAHVLAARAALASTGGAT